MLVIIIIQKMLSFTECHLARTVDFLLVAPLGSASPSLPEVGQQLW